MFACMYTHLLVCPSAMDLCLENLLVNNSIVNSDDIIMM